MKKLVVLTLVILLIFGGCGRSADEQLPEEKPEVERVISFEEDAPEIWERAPELRVSDGVKGVSALKCTTSWYYEKDDGTGTGINACGDSPLGSKKFMEPLVTDAGRAWLNFELNPDSVTVQCWDAKHFGSCDVEGEPVRVEVLAADFADGSWSETISIPLKEGSWVYEVTAQWERSGKYGGTVYYGFYTE